MNNKRGKIKYKIIIQVNVWMDNYILVNWGPIQNYYYVIY